MYTPFGRNEEPFTAETLRLTREHHGSSSFSRKLNHNPTAVTDIQANRGGQAVDWMGKGLSWSAHDIELLDADMASCKRSKRTGSCPSAARNSGDAGSSGLPPTSLTMVMVASTRVLVVSSMFDRDAWKVRISVATLSFGQALCSISDKPQAPHKACTNHVGTKVWMKMR